MATATLSLYGLYTRPQEGDGLSQISAHTPFFSACVVKYFSSSEDGKQTRQIMPDAMYSDDSVSPSPGAVLFFFFNFSYFSDISKTSGLETLELPKCSLVLTPF